MTATSAAGVAPWMPNLGADQSRHFAIAKSAPPAEQLEVLGVLRRPQVSADRGEQATYALRFFGGTVRTDYVRVLSEPDDTQGAAVLVPVTEYRPRERAGVDREASHPLARDGLCLFVRDAVDGGAQGCYSLADVTAGRIRGALGDGRTATVFGVVPDGVASVRLRHPDGRSTIVPVRDNFYLYKAGDGLRFEALEWLDASGSALKSQEGMNISAPQPDDIVSQYCDDGRVVESRFDEDGDAACRRARRAANGR
ncbi:MAG TPA: hypothetical protein VFG79_04775 [Solirubrobacter sp.]|nr:hypothetical protein [Solirubrobacter sp.]